MENPLISKSSFRSACVLSALGTLPIHVMPVLIAAAIHANFVNYSQAGLIAGMYSLGQLVVVIVLPALVIRRVGWRTAVSICLLFIATLYLTTRSQAGFFVGWLLIGTCAGVLNYLGVTAAAAMDDKSDAFAARSGVSLLVAGAAMCAFIWFGQALTYTNLIMILLVVVGILALSSALFYRQPDLIKNETAKLVNGFDNNVTGLKGLLVLFLFVTGQIGFIVFAVDEGGQRGIGIIDATWAIAICKMLAAVVILTSTYDRRFSVFLSSGGTIAPVLVLAAGVLLVAYSNSVWLFLLGFLCWEIAVNLLSASIQARVATLSPQVGTMFLSCVVLSGAAIGPVVNSSAAGHGMQGYFFCFVLLSIFLPAIWYRRSARPGTGMHLTEQ